MKNPLGRLFSAIGGSSAGVYVNNRVKVASLFRGVPPEAFQSRVKDLFLELARAWGNIPFEIANDGEVTALAGSMSLGKNAVFGLAFGSFLNVCISRVPAGLGCLAAMNMPPAAMRLPLRAVAGWLSIFRPMIKVTEPIR